MSRVGQQPAALNRDYALPMVFALMTARESGKVLVERSRRKQPGQIFLRDGCIVHAKAGRAQGKKALLDLLREKERFVSIEAGAEPPEQTIRDSWEDQIALVAGEFSEAVGSMAEPWLAAMSKVAHAGSFGARVVGRVAAEVEKMSQRYAAAGRSLEELGSEADLVEQMVSVLPPPSPWNQALGPFYTTTSVRKKLGDVSRQAVADRVRRGTLLGLKTADSAWVYPVFQFGRRGRVLEGLPTVLQCFDEESVDGWTLAGWLVAPQGSLGGSSVVEWLRAGKDREAAVAVAKAAARRFAR